MREVTRIAYTIDELPESVRDKVVRGWRDTDCFFSGKKIVESLEDFCAYFDFELKDYSLGDRGEHVTIVVPDDVGELAGVRLWKWFNNNFGAAKIIQAITAAEISGMCYDYDIGKPLLDFMKKPTNIDGDELLADIGHAAVKLYSDELSHWHSDEAILEDIRANECEFYIDGKMV